MITKFSSSSPPQRLPLSPVKTFSSKLKIGGSDSEGRCSSLKQGRAYENAATETKVALADTGEHHGKR
jgi:hypothetical protein